MQNEISQEMNLILQCYCNVVLIKELSKNNNLLGSEYFQNLSFDDLNVKTILNTIGVDNQGAVLMSLYAMLVIPRELISTEFTVEYEKINAFIASKTQNTNSTYKSDSKEVNYIRHIRNSVAHAKVSFVPNKTITFNDDYKSEVFSTTLDLRHVGEFFNQLQMVHTKYIRKHQSKVNK